jgi:uncharacterized protein (TIGR02594 family)
VFRDVLGDGIMLTRRTVATALVAAPAVLRFRNAAAQDMPPSELTQLNYPPFGAIKTPSLFLGFKPASAAEKQAAKDVENASPKGPRPIDIAQSFVDRFAKMPDVISQWPAPHAWNPLIVDFFSATATPANNDMIPWCAAFANWCLERNMKNGTRSASSQSFLSKQFKQTTTPKIGDLVVFTCYDSATNNNLGLGHVTFFKEALPGNNIYVVGGNQSADSHSSIISEGTFLTTDTQAYRHVGDKYVPCIFRLNAYVSVV